MELDSLRSLRWIAFVEGWSFLLLLGVAMPLKYFAGLPLAVTVVGGVHGVLFVWYCLAVQRAASRLRWTTGKTLEAYAASIWPFGTFVFDRTLQREEDRMQGKHDSTTAESP